ncbi:MAG: sugar phosphate isomerase/epimerase [Spirochaetaceae bacterium]|jgi:D-psicose/D-tagatose/L-ribulose 3-epimerase|nr:sugar phosphate isomerase/epimerase [Spirochaetaceae bacterium]
MNKLQYYETKNQLIRDSFLQMKKNHPEKMKKKISLSWSSWIFGIEDLETSVLRLKKVGLDYIELGGFHLTSDSGSDYKTVNQILSRNDMKVSGSVGFFSPENDLSSNSAFSRQNAVDYIRRELEFLSKLNADYMIIVPSAVGRPDPLDSSELHRSAEALRLCSDDFRNSGIKAAIEPIRSAEVSLVHTVSDALEYIRKVGSDDIGHINGDIYHMLLEEEHIGEAILRAGDRLVNLHLADSNRDCLGKGMMDLDTVIMASYLIGMNRDGCYLTPEPLGPYSVPYDLMNSPCNVDIMDKLVFDSVTYFREREEIVRSL